MYVYQHTRCHLSLLVIVGIALGNYVEKCALLCGRYCVFIIVCSFAPTVLVEGGVEPQQWKPVMWVLNCVGAVGYRVALCWRTWPFWHLACCDVGSALDT
jgi:hypothetical protein